MADDPKYVRLATRLSRGMVCDVKGSGWSISGLDVRQFPTTPQAARFVRAKLNAGVLEPASKSEWDEAHDDALEKEVLAQNPDYREKASAVQEGRLQRVAREQQAKLAERLSADAEAEEEELRELEQEDREARLQEQKDADLMTDDPQKQKDRTAGLVAPKKKSGKGKGKAKASSSEE